LTQFTRPVYFILVCGRGFVAHSIRSPQSSGAWPTPTPPPSTSSSSSTRRSASPPPSSGDPTHPERSEMQKTSPTTHAIGRLQTVPDGYLRRTRIAAASFVRGCSTFFTRLSGGTGGGGGGCGAVGGAPGGAPGPAGEAPLPPCPGPRPRCRRLPALLFLFSPGFPERGHTVPPFHPWLKAWNIGAWEGRGYRWIFSRCRVFFSPLWALRAPARRRGGHHIFF